MMSRFLCYGGLVSILNFVLVYLLCFFIIKLQLRRIVKTQVCFTNQLTVLIVLQQIKLLLILGLIYEIRLWNNYSSGVIYKVCHSQNGIFTLPTPMSHFQVFSPIPWPLCQSLKIDKLLYIWLSNQTILYKKRYKRSEITVLPYRHTHHCTKTHMHCIYGCLTISLYTKGGKKGQKLQCYHICRLTITQKHTFTNS